MSDASASILPRKIATRAPSRAKSGFSPDMLRVFCEVAGESLGELMDTRVKVSLESVGLEPLKDVVPAEDSPVCAAVVGLNGIEGAASLLPDGNALFHLMDIMLGGDPAENEPVVECEPSSLVDQFCANVSDLLMRSLVQACDAVIGPGSCVFDGKVEIVHEGAGLLIAPLKSDVMTIEIAMLFGGGEREGKFSMLVPLTTVDAVSGAGSVDKKQPAYENGPWFDHMKSSVSLMELDTVALLHTEQMTLAALSRLDIGSVIPLNKEAVTSVKIALEDGGDIIASGELGVSSGRRVINLDDAPNHAFLAPIRKLIV